MTIQPAHSIVITYWEGDETKDTPFTALFYCEWTCGTKSYYAHADESMFDGAEDEDEFLDGAGNWSHRGIPDRVRRALAALIFPPLDLSDEARYNGSEYLTTCPHCGTKFGVN